MACSAIGRLAIGRAKLMMIGSDAHHRPVHRIEGRRSEHRIAGVAASDSAPLRARLPTPPPEWRWGRAEQRPRRRRGRIDRGWGANGSGGVAATPRPAAKHPSAVRSAARSGRPDRSAIDQDRRRPIRCPNPSPAITEIAQNTVARLRFAAKAIPRTPQLLAFNQCYTGRLRGGHRESPPAAGLAMHQRQQRAGLRDSRRRGGRRYFAPVGRGTANSSRPATTGQCTDHQDRRRSDRRQGFRPADTAAHRAAIRP